MRTNDLVAGLAVAGLALPEAVAYAGIAGLPPQRAVLAAIAGCLVYAVFGRSRFAVVTPTSSSAAILAAIIATLPGDDALLAGFVTVTTALTGSIFLVAHVGRLGLLTGFISRPVLRGFAFGLAVTIILHQLPAIGGVSIRSDNLLGYVVALAESLPRWHTLSVTVGAAALTLLLVAKRFPALPGAFLVLVIGVIVSAVADLPGHGVAVVGPITMMPTTPSLPTPSWSQFAQLVRLTLPLVLIVFAESWGTIRSLGLRHGDTVAPDRELGALGAANLAAALVQGMPVGAGFSAGAANEAAGATSRWAAVIGAVGLAVLVAVGAPLIARLPQPVLAAVVISALTHALDPAPILRLWRLDRDQWVAIGAAVGVVALGVVDGMLLAIAFSLAALLRRMSMPQVCRLGRLGDTRDYVDVVRHTDAVLPVGIGVWRPSEQLFFANAERILGMIGRAVAAEPGLRAVVLSLEETYDLDSTALEALIDAETRLAASGLPLHLARARDPVRDLLKAADALDLLRRSTYNVDDAVEAARSEVEGRNPP